MAKLMSCNASLGGSQAKLNVLGDINIFLSITICKNYRYPPFERLLKIESSRIDSQYRTQSHELKVAALILFRLHNTN
jgi:hypothetical protein